MNYQSIILTGKISSKPRFEMNDKEEPESARFQMTIKDRKEREIVLWVSYIGKMIDQISSEVILDRKALIDGEILLDAKKKYIIQTKDIHLYSFIRGSINKANCWL